MLTAAPTTPPRSAIANEQLNASWPNVESLKFDQNPNPLRTELFEEPIQPSLADGATPKSLCQ